MSAIRGRIVDGNVVLDHPAGWPTGTEVVVNLVPERPENGMREEDWPTTPEGIAALLQRWDDILPLEMTAEEEADIAEWRRKVKEYTIAHQDEAIEGLFP